MRTLEKVVEGLRDQMGLGDPVLADALHYLKEYQEKTDEICKLAKIMADSWELRKQTMAFEDRNEPLTWDELRSMEGKPVYVKLLGAYESYPNASRWMLVQSDVSFGNAWFIDRSGARYCFYEKDMNEIWQAYRKERS